MDKAEFDKFAEEYLNLHRQNIKLSGESPEFFAEYKIRDVYEMLTSVFPENGKILDFGAGVGGSVPYFRKYFKNARLTCLDVSERSREVACARFSDDLDYRLFDGHRLPFADESFDLVFAACVFHHIPKANQVNLLGEWHRLLKPGGMAVIFEHNPFNPLTVRAVNTCPFDENAELIPAGLMRERMAKAGFKHPKSRYRLFVPGFLRGLRPIEGCLYWCPVGAQYMAYAVKPKGIAP